MTTSPPITENQISMLRALLTKKGWSEAYFAWKANVALTALTTSQARSWIARLTKETKGKPRPATLLEPPSAPTTDEPRHKDSANAPATPVDTAANPAPSPADIEAAAATMMTQLGLVGEPARQTIIRTLEQVGVRAGFAAVMLALAAQQPSRLTALEHFVVFCRQLQAGRE